MEELYTIDRSELDCAVGLHVHKFCSQLIWIDLRGEKLLDFVGSAKQECWYL